MSKRNKAQAKAAASATTMPFSLDRALNQNAFQAFLVFFAFVFWAFWPSYFARLSEQPDFRSHTHGVAMTLWCVMLIGQAYLIRTKHRGLHKAIGKTSYFLVPGIVVATLNLDHFRMRGLAALPAFPRLGLFQLALMVNAVVVFLALYGLAIYHRHKAPVHARYMVCTVFPLFTPVTDRLIYRNFPSIVGLVPVLDDSPLVPVAGFLLADALLLALVLWDWLGNKRLDVFPIALVLLVAYHVSVMTLYRFDAWSSFARFFFSLPLS